MLPRTIVDDFSDIGRELLHAESRGYRELQQYKWQLSGICSLLSHTHSIVVEKLEHIEAAQSLAEARIVVDDLQSYPLTNAFRAQGLCDIFEGFGKSLRRLLDVRQATAFASPPQPLTDTSKSGQWAQFCEILEGREAQVADLYARQLHAISDAVYAAAEADLPGIKTLVAQANAALTDQINDFDALSRDFARRSTR